MAGIFAGNIGQESLSKLVPWFLLAVVVLYFVGFVNGAVHGAAFGTDGGAMAWSTSSSTTPVTSP